MAPLCISECQAFTSRPCELITLSVFLFYIFIKYFRVDSNCVHILRISTPTTLQNLLRHRAQLAVRSIPSTWWLWGMLLIYSNEVERQWYVLWIRIEACEGNAAGEMPTAVIACVCRLPCYTISLFVHVLDGGTSAGLQRNARRRRFNVSQDTRGWRLKRHKFNVTKCSNFEGNELIQIRIMIW